jgi:nitronate monooxygenase
MKAAPDIDVRAALRFRLRLPVIVAPMFRVSTVALVVAACEEGLLGSFPAHGTRDTAELRTWIESIQLQLQLGKSAPFAVNLVTHASNERLEADLAVCEELRVPIILSSKSAPTRIVDRIHGYGGWIFHDVANRRHVEKAVDAGVDGLTAVACGAGGHTGSLNPFALINVIRRTFGGPVVLAGAITTGRDVLAAQAMGADFAYMGTRFLATEESGASPEHKKMVVDHDGADVCTSAAFTGAPANWLIPSLEAAGVDLDALCRSPERDVASLTSSQRRWKDLWTSGHGIGLIDDIPPARERCRRLASEYEDAVCVMSQHVGRREQDQPAA